MWAHRLAVGDEQRGIQAGEREREGKEEGRVEELSN